MPSTARLELPSKSVDDCFVGLPLATFPLLSIITGLVVGLGFVRGFGLGFGRGFGRGFFFPVTHTLQLLRHFFSIYNGLALHCPVLDQYGQFRLSSTHPKIIM